jgi:hypothetical protein
MDSQDWWIFGIILGCFLIIQSFVLFSYIRQTQFLMDNISRMRHVMAELAVSNMEIERAYKMLLLHNGKVLEERWGTGQN